MAFLKWLTDLFTVHCPDCGGEMEQLISPDSSDMKVFKYVPFDNEVEFKQELNAFLDRFGLSSEPITDERDKRIICAIAEKRGCPSMINFPWIRAE